MRNISTSTSMSTTGAIVFAIVGALALAIATLPSPARLKLYDEVHLELPDVKFPESITPPSGADIAFAADYPLFNGDRQKDPAAQSLTALPSLEDYRLSGVIVAGKRSLAIVERKATKGAVTLKVGDLLDGRTVSAITADGVSFIGAGSSEVLSLPKIIGVKLTDQAARNSETPPASKRPIATGARDNGQIGTP